MPLIQEQKKLYGVRFTSMMSVGEMLQLERQHSSGARRLTRLDGDTPTGPGSWAEWQDCSAHESSYWIFVRESVNIHVELFPPLSILQTGPTEGVVGEALFHLATLEWDFKWPWIGLLYIIVLGNQPLESIRIHRNDGGGTSSVANSSWVVPTR